MKQPEIHITKDGSSTLYSEEYNQFYHNPNGAVAESRHVYFEQSGLLDALTEKRSLSIFETGFGSGLNLALLKSYLEAQDITTEFHFFSVEASPLSAGRSEEHTSELQPRGHLVCRLMLVKDHHLLLYHPHVHY